MPKKEVGDMGSSIEDRGAGRQKEMEELVAWMKSKVKQIDKVLYESLHRFSSPSYLHNSYLKGDYSYDERAISKGVLDPAIYLLNLGGKRLRALTTVLVMESFGVDSDKFIEFTSIPEVIHTGTLIHDDIEDGSSKRRGEDAVHVRYGIATALNLGDLMFFLPLNAVLDSKKIDERTKNTIIGICIKDMSKLGIGQATELVWHDFKVDPFGIKESQYMQMVADKTGALTGISMKIGAAIGGADAQTIQKVGVIGNLLGIVFQIQDDLLNITPNKVSESKGGVGDDMTEGKISIFVIYALSHSKREEAERLIEILKMHTKDGTLIKEAIGIITHSGALEYGKELQTKLLDEALKDLNSTLKESQARQRLHAMLNFVAARSF